VSEDDRRLADEHATFLSHLLGHNREPDDDEAASTPEEVAGYFRRPPERELTPADLARPRSIVEPTESEHDHHDHDREATPAALRALVAAARHSRRA
jgi:hypothetical protein